MKTLIIEDDPNVAEVNAAYLAGRSGYELIGIAGTVHEGGKMLRQHRPDLVLLDVFLPDGSGLDLLAEARAQGWADEVLILTAARDAASVQQALQGGAADFLIKPFTRERLYAALDTIEKRRAAMQGGEREFTQSALDKLFHREGATRPEAAGTGTAGRVLDVLRESGTPLSAEEVGARLGINRATAWRYLEQLAAQEQAEVVLEYGSVGRPTKGYRAK